MSERTDDPGDDDPLNRRRFLWSLGAVGVAGVAGCTRTQEADEPLAGGTQPDVTTSPTLRAPTDAATNAATDTATWIPDAPTLAFGEPYETDHVTLRVDAVDLFDGFGVTEYCRRDLTDSPVETATMTDGDQLARIVVSVRNVSGSALGIDLRNFMIRAGGEAIDDDRFLGHSDKIAHPGANGLHDGAFGPSTATGQFEPVCFEVDGETRPNRFTEEAQYFDAGEAGSVWLYAVVSGNRSTSEVAVGFEEAGLYDVTPRFVSGPEQTADPGPSAWWMGDSPSGSTDTNSGYTDTDSGSTDTPPDPDDPDFGSTGTPPNPDETDSGSTPTQPDS
jgi:hypothetical protein